MLCETGVALGHLWFMGLSLTGLETLTAVLCQGRDEMTRKQSQGHAGKECCGEGGGVAQASRPSGLGVHPPPVLHVFDTILHLH